MTDSVADQVTIAWFQHAHHNGLYETAVMPDGTNVDLFEEVFRPGYREGFTAGLNTGMEGVASD